MSWLITGSEKNPTDPFRSQVSLLLHGDGTNGSTTITDSGPSPKTVTAVGNAQVDTAQSKFGGASALFDGTGDYLELAPVGIGLARTDNFTCEAWIRLAALPASGSFLMFLNGTAGGGEQYMSIKNISGTYVSDIVVSNGTTAREEDYTISSISTNTWYHKTNHNQTPYLIRQYSDSFCIISSLFVNELEIESS